MVARNPTPTEIAPADRLPTLRSSLFAVLVLALMLGSGATMQGVFSAVQEGAKAELGLSDFQLSLVQGLATSIPVAILSIPMGFLIDRRNRIRLLIVLSAVWTIGTILTAFSGNMPVLFFSRMLVGLGSTCSVAAAISIAADYCLPSQRGRSMLILTLGRYIGSAAAFALGGWLYGLYSDQAIFGLTGWRGVHLALGLGSGVLTLLLFFVKEPVRQEVKTKLQLPIKRALDELWKRKHFLIPLFAGQLSVTMADAAAGIWAAPVLSRNFGLQPDQFAGWMGLVVFTGGMVGSVLGGLSADIGQKSGKQGGILLGAVIASGLAIPMAAFPIMPSVVGFGIALGLLLLGGTITGLVTATAISVLVPNEIRGVCLGLFIAVAGVIGFGLAPMLVTFVSAMMGGDSELAPALAIVGLIVSTLSFLSFFVAMKRAPKSAIA